MMKGKSITGNERGITLIELLVVIGIVAIISGFAVPVYMNYLPSLRLKSAVQRMTSTISLARMTAVTRNRTCRVVFVPANNYYYVYVDLNENGALDPGETAAAQIEMESVGGNVGIPLPTGVDFGAASGVTGPPPQTGTTPPADGVDLENNILVTGPRGTTNAVTNTETIYLKNVRNETQAIRTMFTGAVRAYQWTGSGWR